jgi:hypothetical protein
MNYDRRFGDIIVTFGGRWKTKNIIDYLNLSNPPKFVLTFITDTKYNSIKKKWFMSSSIKDCIYKYNFSNIVKIISDIRSQYSKLTKDYNKNKIIIDSIHKLIYDYRQNLSIIIEQFQDYNIYDDELEVIFTRTLTKDIISIIVKDFDRIRQLLYNTVKFYIIDKDIKKVIINNVEQIESYISLSITDDIPKITKNNISIGIYSAGLAEIDIVTMGYIYMNLLGYNVDARIDIGVNRIYKTRNIIEEVNNNDIIITTAGMEAILPTVLSNICYKPVIAVPSSISYGLGSNGLASAHSIKLSNAPGIAMFNIGNIYGACVFANCISHYLINRPINSNTKLSNLYEPIYKMNNETTSIIDIANGIRNIYPLINTNDKSKEQLEYFMDIHKGTIILRSTDNDIILDGIEPYDTGISKFYLIGGSSKIINNKKLCYDTTSKVLIICAGYSDLGLAKECKYYLDLIGIHSKILNYLHMNQILNMETDIFNHYHIFITICGRNGTLSNIVGGTVGKKPIIAIPNSNDELTLTSILNNCVGGISVVENKNTYSASCLVASILFNYEGNIIKLINR